MVVAVLAVLAAGWAVLASVTLFPYLSVNQDETVYLLQADSLTEGRLFPPAPPAEADAFVPWLSITSGDHYVPKYSPVWPAVIAVGRLLTGSHHAAQALVAAGVVVLTYLLAREVLGRRWPSVLASLFVVLSPFFLMQSVTFLSYLPNVLLLEGFAVSFLRGVRQSSRWLLVASGGLIGLAFFARPFDAVLFALPFGFLFVISRRHSWRTLIPDVAAFAMGTVPPMVAMLAFFKAATGSPLRSPFNLLDKSDTLGFGAKRVFPWDPELEFGAGQAWHGLLTHSMLLSFWCFGGLVLIGLSVVALRHRKTGLEGWMGLVALTIPIGYLLFWGSYLLTRLEGPWRIGPFYYLPVLVPLAILGAGGFSRLWHLDHRLAWFGLLGMSAVSGLVIAGALGDQRERTTGLRALHSPVEERPLDGAIVFLPRYGPQLMTPFTKLRNPSFDQKVVWALDRGDRANLRALDLFPSRKPYLLTEGAPGDLHQLVRRRGATVTAEVQLRVPPGEEQLVLGVGRGERLETFPVDVSNQATQRVQLIITKDEVSVQGSLGPRRVESRTPDPDEPDVLLWLLRPAAGDAPETEAASAFDISALGEEVEVLLPATGSSDQADAPSLEVVAGN